MQKLLSDPSDLSGRSRGRLIRDYRRYRLSMHQRLLVWCGFGSLFGCLGFVFYKHWLGVVIMACCSPFATGWVEHAIVAKRRQELTLQFKQALYALSTSLAAGKSLENAFRDVVQDLRMVYADPETYIIRELEMINSKTANGEPIEQAITAFSDRAGIDDIANFADVIRTCKRTGGDLVETIRRSSHMIGEKIEIEQEIAVMVAQKKFESQTMAIIPIFIVGFLSISSADYMAPLYKGIGILIMSVCLAALGACYYFTRRIMNIRL